MSEPLQPTPPGPSTSSRPAPTPAPAPVSPASPAAPSGGAGEPNASEESLRRKLLMGAALLLAMTSIYAGVFNVGRLAQIVLAAGATMAVVLALSSGNRRRG